MATARIGRRRRHKLHKRTASLRSELRRVFWHSYYDAHKCCTFLFPRGSDRPSVAVTDLALAGGGRTDWRMACALIGGSRADWQRPGFAEKVLMPVFRGWARSAPPWGER